MNHSPRPPNADDEPVDAILLDDAPPRSWDSSQRTMWWTTLLLAGTALLVALWISADSPGWGAAFLVGAAAALVHTTRKAARMSRAGKPLRFERHVAEFVASFAVAVAIPFTAMVAGVVAFFVTCIPSMAVAQDLEPAFQMAGLAGLVAAAVVVVCWCVLLWRRRKDS